jgi:predicted GNAT family acetyltransferase
MAEHSVIHDQRQSRFALVATEGPAVCIYQIVGETMWLTHTEVHPDLQGRGIAAELVQAALDHARAQGLKVRPACSYVRTYMRRHPETQDLLDSA